MRIGFVCPYSFDEPGGVQAHILDLAHVLIDLGHEVKVIGPCSADTVVPDFVVKGGKSVGIRYNGSVARLSFSPRTFRRVRDFIADGDFDIVHIHEPNSPSFSLAALMVAEGPIVATYHASSSGSKALKVALPVLRPLLEKIHGGIAVSEMARRWQVEQLGGDPVLIPNGVDTALFHERFRAVASDKKPQEKVEIVFLGRLDEPRKGLDVLVQAFAGLEDRAHVVVIGGGTKRKVAGMSFVGRVSDEEKAEILARADIYVAPNVGGESFGIVLVEAMAAGCAVVASDLEAFAAVCDANAPQPAGVLFRTGDAADLRAKLDMLIASPQMRQQLVDAGRARAEVFDWSSVVKEVLRVYDTVADGTKVKVTRRFR
ncbi:MAG: glycosyltransferase family 4 protein [Corynebacterium sp.]|uniref:glycosyltransferase family 4 protein n=1 Tax=Corynebacterium sp. TaxID=1720 RepID=UPI0026DB715A|nr:glycosyltransferase family 4 protein [Corynebacterium sp.]MDO4760298.1 glycosyltransferase family 4 protein [Corynebacterium sp.]